jgi:hypothetical protein
MPPDQAFRASMPSTRLLEAAFNLIDAATTTITNRSKALIDLAFFSGLLKTQD